MNRKYTRQRFEPIRDPNSDPIGRDWFVAAIVDLACQSVCYGLPVLMNVLESRK